MNPPTPSAGDDGRRRLLVPVPRWASGVGAAAVGLALAAGVTLGEYLGRPVSGARDRYDERVRRRAMTAD